MNNESIPRRIHVFGASGSGTTTLGEALSKHLGYFHFDTDYFFWEQTNPPFTTPRVKSERIRLLSKELETVQNWVLSGSLCGWGDVFIDQFDLVIFKAVPTPIRLERLKVRERTRYGDMILPGGSMHENHHKFLLWAAGYDSGDVHMRSRAMHEAWLSKLDIPVVKIDIAMSIQSELEEVLRFIA